MSQSSPAREPDPRDEPMSADKRTIVIALVAVVALVTVGFVSAAIFTTSACEAIDPTLVDDRVASVDVEDVITDVSGDADAARDSVEALADIFGPPVAAADTSGASGVATMTAGPVATGTTTTSVSVENATVLATAELDDPTIVGSGDQLFALAIANDLTDQVDGIYPLDAQLDDTRDCFDTASIGLPLAFYLDAADGQLLLLRVDEDGGEPQLELRDPEEGALWRLDLDTPVAQPGVLAERSTAGLGEDLVVMAHRTTPDDEAPVLSGVDRSDGSLKWTSTRDELGAALTDEADQLNVLDVGAEVALVSVHPDAAVGGGSGDGEPDPDDATLLAVSLADGSVQWEVSITDPIIDAVIVGEQARVATLTDDGVVLQEAALARLEPIDVLSNDDVQLTVTESGALLAAGGEQVLVEADEVSVVDVSVGVLDVAVDGAAVSFVLGDEDASFLVTFDA